MKKRKTYNTLKRSILLIPSVFALASCSALVPIYLNEEGKSEFCANVQAMETDPNYLYFYSPKKNDSDTAFDESENFDMFYCQKGEDGLLRLRKDGEQTDMETQPAGEGSAYEFGIASLEKHGYKDMSVRKCYLVQVLLHGIFAETVADAEQTESVWRCRWNTPASEGRNCREY